MSAGTLTVAVCLANIENKETSNQSILMLVQQPRDIWNGALIEVGRVLGICIELCLDK